MLPMRKVPLMTLFALGIAAQAVGQAPRPKRELDVPYVPTSDEIVVSSQYFGEIMRIPRKSRVGDRSPVAE